METTHGLFWSTNTQGHPYEDRPFQPFGDFLNRLDEAVSEADADRWLAKIEERKARGLVYAVMDGVGSARRGMRAAQETWDKLHELYTRRAPLTATYGSVADLLREANATVFSWGTEKGIAGQEDVGGERTLGAAAVTAAYFSPLKNVTILHTGDTVAFHHAPAIGSIRRLTANQVAGAGIRGYIGFGPGLPLDVVPVDGFLPGDSIVLVTDGVVPKGMQVDEVHDILREEGNDPQRAAAEIGQRARSHKSNDDITVVVIRLDSWG